MVHLRAIRWAAVSLARVVARPPRLPGDVQQGSEPSGLAGLSEKGLYLGCTTRTSPSWRTMRCPVRCTAPLERPFPHDLPTLHVVRVGCPTERFERGCTPASRVCGTSRRPAHLLPRPGRLLPLADRNPSSPGGRFSGRLRGSICSRVPAQGACLVMSGRNLTIPTCCPCASWIREFT